MLLETTTTLSKSKCSENPAIINVRLHIHFVNRDPKKVRFPPKLISYCNFVNVQICFQSVIDYCVKHIKMCKIRFTDCQRVFEPVNCKTNILLKFAPFVCLFSINEANKLINSTIKCFLFIPIDVSFILDRARRENLINV